MKFKIGDMVRINKVSDHSHWVTSMDDTIGKLGEIVGIDDISLPPIHNGIKYYVRFNEGTHSHTWYYFENELSYSLPDHLFTF